MNIKEKNSGFYVEEAPPEEIARFINVFMGILQRNANPGETVRYKPFEQRPIDVGKVRGEHIRNSAIGCFKGYHECGSISTIGYLTCLLRHYSISINGAIDKINRIKRETLEAVAKTATEVSA